MFSKIIFKTLFLRPLHLFEVVEWGQKNSLKQSQDLCDASLNSNFWASYKNLCTKCQKCFCRVTHGLFIFVSLQIVFFLDFIQNLNVKNILKFTVQKWWKIKLWKEEKLRNFLYLLLCTDNRDSCWRHAIPQKRLSIEVKIIAL